MILKSDGSMDNTSILISVILLIVGFVFVFFHDKIIEMQGESKDYTYEQRKYGMIIVGIGSLIIGTIFLLISVFN